MPVAQTRCDHPELNWRAPRRPTPSYREGRRRAYENPSLARYVVSRTLTKPHADLWLRSDVEPVSSAKVKEGDVFVRLGEAARAGNESAFLEILKEARWQGRPVLDFIRAIQFAFEAGAHIAARQISAEGARLHPDNAELQKQAYILSPPKIIVRTATAGTSHRANRDWLKAHTDEYRNQWVALRDGELLGTASSMEALVEQVGETKGILLTVV